MQSAYRAVGLLSLDFPLQLDQVTVDFLNNESKEKWLGLSFSTCYRRISVILGFGTAGISFKQLLTPKAFFFIDFKEIWLTLDLNKKVQEHCTYSQQFFEVCTRVFVFYGWKLILLMFLR